MTTAPAASVIIPAYNESKALKRLLPRLHDASPDARFEVIVVCNGCHDDSFEVASRFGDNIRVINQVEGSKTKALNAGDAIAKAFPRIYLDADSEVTPDDLAAICKTLEKPGVLAAGAMADFDASGSSWAVAAYYRAWSLLPFGRNPSSIGGSGIYALSREGRARFEAFPDVIADDGFINHLFTAAEKARCTDCVVRITPPRNWWSLVKIKSRVYRGNRQLQAMGIHPPAESNKTGSGIVSLILSPRTMLPATIYAFTQVAARLYAHLIQPLTRQRWQRDETTR
ncbi:glycosyltransferase [Pseudokordiimonas caeni]|uniref:glycosyltransferase n=1 Tax=Pseudokordiimonas caeni TaxID=2997908 RepID=UPI002810BEA8|nr:glycosyltransferase family 2 protein [Pseudokordiimonas caeni]